MVKLHRCCKKVVSWTALCLAALTVVAVPASAQTIFTVSGNKILKNGHEFVVHGVNINGLNWVWGRNCTDAIGPNGWYDKDSIAWLWRFNTVRVNCLLQPVSGSYTTNNNLDNIVSKYTSEGVVVIFDAHDRIGDYYSNSSTPSLTTAADWFEGLASKYKNNPYVWFDLCNEPGTTALDPQWVTMHQRLISVIRDSAGANNILLVEGGAWGQDAGNWNSGNVPTANSEILSNGQSVLSFNGKTYGNIAFSIHIYDQWNYGDARLSDFISRVYAKNYALVVGEYSNANNSTNTTAADNSMISAAQKYRFGRIAWAWDGGYSGVLTTASPEPDGWAIDTGSVGTRPGNLSWLGGVTWDDTRAQ